MLDKFNFNLSQSLKERYPNADYNYIAEKISDDTYKVTWMENSETLDTNYTTKEVESAINDEDWIIKSK